MKGYCLFGNTRWQYAQAAAIGGSSGSVSLPADLVQRAALLLNPNVALSPLAQNLLVRAVSLVEMQHANVP